MKHNTSVRIPKKNSYRTTIYLDESGEASLKGTSNFFILSGVIAKNTDFQKVQEYYFNLKKKYLGYTGRIHAVELFSDKKVNKSDLKVRLMRIKKYRKQYIKELATFLDSIPFVFIVISVNKKKLNQTAPKKFISQPYKTTINRAIGIWLRQNPGKSQMDFEKEVMANIINMLKKEKVEAKDYYLPLKLCYKKILENYFEKYTKIFCYWQRPSKCEINFESSPNQERIIRFTHKLASETDHSGKGTSLAWNIQQHLYSISFPNKKAKFLGLEIADIISYGYNLSLNRVLSKNIYYLPIWEVLQKRRREAKRLKGFESSVKLI